MARRDMGPSSSASGDRFGRGLLVTTLVFLALNVVLRIPDLLIGRYPLEIEFYLSDPSRLYYFFSLDLFCLFTLLAVIPHRRMRRWPYRVLAGVVVFLLCYRTYDALVSALLGRDPILYADVSHALGAAYLAVNLSFSWQDAVLGVGGAAIVGGLIWVLPSLLQTVHVSLRRVSVRRGVLATHFLIWPLVGVAAIQERGIERQTYQEVCLLTVECIGYNLRASARLGQQLDRRAESPIDSTYRRFPRADWAGHPSMYLVVMESYGSVLETDPTVKNAYDRLMQRAADSLRASGWRSATARSRAPVVGGLSWLSVATILTGTPVRYQPTYEVLRRELFRFPHLVWLLQKKGYTTATLQPPVRARPGLRVGNPYSFDRTIYFDDLDYDGPAYGWGRVPDQYSLSIAHERVVASSSRPFFLLFETVTSHGRWSRSPPPLVPEPRILNRDRARIDDRPTLPGLGKPLLAERSGSDLRQSERFFRHIQYDWEVLVEYARTRAPSGSLFMVVGDHQPYFADSGSRTTPVHVFTKDGTLIDEFERYGFVAGLRPSPAADTLHHAGLYSLLVRVLSASAPDGSDSRKVPPYRPHGVERAALLESNSK